MSASLVGSEMCIRDSRMVVALGAWPAVEVSALPRRGQRLDRWHRKQGGFWELQISGAPTGLLTRQHGHRLEKSELRSPEALNLVWDVDTELQLRSAEGLLHVRGEAHKGSSKRLERHPWNVEQEAAAQRGCISSGAPWPYSKYFARRGREIALRTCGGKAPSVLMPSHW
eukprot:1200405-Alexandrium_andersonii.AAC.1